MTNKLQVLPVKTQENRDIKTIPSPLPQPNFLMLVVGGVRSGKGVFLCNMLMNNNFGYDSHFDKIIYISPTLPSDKTGQILYKNEDIIKITEGLDHLEEILEMIVETQKKSESNLMLVLDDILGLLGSNQSYFSSLCSKYRHYNMSIIVTTQDMRRIPLTTRYNASSFILFRSNNKKEIEKLEEELSSTFPDFLDIYKEATDKRFSFLYLDMEKAKAFENFDTLLYEK